MTTHKPRPAPTVGLAGRMIDTFGQEWTDLDDATQAAIYADWLDDPDHIDLAEYRRRIGAGNLAAYAATLRAGLVRLGLFTGPQGEDE